MSREGQARRERRKKRTRKKSLKTNHHRNIEIDGISNCQVYDIEG